VSEQPNPIMAMLLNHASFVGAAEMVENTIMPIPAQLDFGPGDHAILAMANTPLENDFVILRGADPEKHAETFPDWEERVLNSYVLCQYFSRTDPEFKLGWFSRLKVMPITEYRYREARKWRKGDWPEEVPDWAEAYFLRYTDQLSQAAPEVVPHVVSCPACGGRNIAIVVLRHIEFMARAGTVVIDGVEKYVPVTTVDETDTHQAQLRCLDCHTPADLTDDEWALPGISN